MWQSVVVNQTDATCEWSMVVVLNCVPELSHVSQYTSSFTLILQSRKSTKRMTFLYQNTVAMIFRVGGIVASLRCAVIDPVFIPSPNTI